MSVTNFIPELWSANLNTSLRGARVFGGLVNRDYEGEISNEGDTVHITRPAAITMKDYSGTVVYETPTATDQTLVIDQARYFAFDVDDVDAVQANADLISVYTDEGAEAMADDDDGYIAGLYGSAHADNVIAKSSLTSSNVYAALVNAATLLNAKKVPQQGRWAVVSPELFGIMLQAPEFINASDLPESVVQTGALGMIAGFRVYMSSAIETANDGTDDVEHNMLGHRMAITFADQLAEVEAIRREASFADAVRGLHLYGAKAARPEALVDLRRIA